MKHTLCFITILLGSLLNLYANNENDSLLKVLDKVLSERLVYTEKKEATIKELKAKKKEQKTLDDMYRLNSEILHQYETFVCDSAEQYINENFLLYTSDAADERSSVDLGGRRIIKKNN